MRDGIRFIGGDPDKLAGILRAPSSVTAYLELHIEQGGTLDADKINIGVVEGIVGITQWEVTIEGFANHAGTTPMNQRRDALLAAAMYIQAVNRIVKSVPGRHVGTVGKIQAIPGAFNVIPGKVITALELRDLDSKVVRMLFEKVSAEARSIGSTTGTRFSFNEVNSSMPALTDPLIRDLIDRTAKGLNFTTKYLPSGAGHDAQEMAKLGPIGMIFIPSIAGISHSPREFSRAEDIANGANVLLHTLLALDGQTIN
jgi:N-carbamoyl-L-amino-acid hydrolase